MDKGAIIEFLSGEFPHYTKIGIDEVGEGRATIRHKVGREELRPGGTVAGPVLMQMADVVIYIAILGKLGMVPLTVTTNLNINFLRKPSADRDLIAKCELIKVGRTLIVGEVNLFSEGETEPVAHCVATYAIPPKAIK